ncbi:MAG: DUF1499 domain-containing protein [Maricaulaceae bacterium]
MTNSTTPPVEGPKDLATISKTRVLMERVALWLRRGAWMMALLVPIFYMVAALGTRWGWWSLKTGFGTLSRDVGPKLMVCTFLVGVICLVFALLSSHRRKGVLASALAILVPVAGMVYGGKIKATAEKLPFIHDITTNTQDVPTFSQTLLDLRAKTDRVNTVDYVGKVDLREKELYSVLQTRAYPDIRPLILSGSVEQVFGQALATAQQLGWDIHTEDAANGILEATDMTFWYGFKDDIVIRIHASEGGGTVLDMRSISRIGQSDLGANAKRVRKFMKSFK